MHFLDSLRAALIALTVAGLMVPSVTFAQGVAPTSTPLLPVRGDAAGRVVILLFSDFECPYCARVEPVLDEVRKALGSDVQVVFKHTPLPIHPRAPLAHEAAIEAGRQGRFWEMHDLLFADQKRLDKADLVARAKQLGLDVKAFASALEDGRHKAAVARDSAEARALGVTGTPTLFVNGQKLVGAPAASELIAYLRDVLSGKTSNATEDDAPVDPKAFNLTDAPTLGPADAPITIVEFSDFQCPFCARATSTVDSVTKAYGGKVRRVFKHFPLDFHPDAPLAHRAALAAGAQGKFWEMYELMFEHQRTIKRPDLLKHAATLGLDLTRFAKDIDDAGYEALVKRDLAEGVGLGIDGTPTFFVNGRRIVGAQPVDVFKSAIDRELARSATVNFVRPSAGASVASDVLDFAMSRGPADAAVTIRWYADFGSPLHKDAVAMLKKVLAARPNDVRLLFNHRPLEGRDDALLAHEATLAAAEQGKFWEVHDLLVARPLQSREALIANVGRLGVDREWFEEGLSTGRARAALERHVAEARKREVRGTPTFFINETRVDGLNFEALEAVIEKEMKTGKTRD